MFRTLNRRPVRENKSGFRDSGRRSTPGFACSRCALAAVCRFRQRLFHAIQQVAPRIRLGKQSLRNWRNIAAQGAAGRYQNFDPRPIA